MSRRIDIELTSSRGDGTWTWRAAGARQPKGEIDGAMLPAGSGTGDVLRVEVEIYLDGLTVVAVLPAREQRPEPERLEVVGSRRRDERLVTATLTGRGPRGDERPRGREREDDRRRRPGRGRGAPGDKPEAQRRRRRQAEAPQATTGPRSAATRAERAPRPEGPAPPRAARLRAGRKHRTAVLSELPEEQKPIAEQLLRGGIPAVRQALDKQNVEARTQGLPEVRADALLALAEQLLPRLRTAEWLDRAEAALAGLSEVDLRDLRSVVVAADAVARDEHTRALAQQLRDGLAARVDEEHRRWMAEVDELIAEGRAIRALRLSSRPPKAGAPLPPELAERLASAASAALGSDVGQERWATLLDAVALSPVRLAVKPAGIPASPGEELRSTVARVGSRVPHIAAMFGIAPRPEAPARRTAGSRNRRTGGHRPSAEGAAGPDASALGGKDLDLSGDRPSDDGPQDPVVVEELGQPLDEG